jgi:hypothetical protein
MLTVAQQNQKNLDFEKLVAHRIEAFKDYYGREMTKDEASEFKKYYYHFFRGIGIMIEEFIKEDIKKDIKKEVDTNLI